MSTPDLSRLEALTAFALKNRATKVEFEGIKIELDRSAFAQPEPLAHEPVIREDDADPYDGVCPCGHEKADHNPSSGCGAGCPDWRCAGEKDAPGPEVTAGQYG